MPFLDWAATVFDVTAGGWSVRQSGGHRQQESIPGCGGSQSIPYVHKLCEPWENTTDHSAGLAANNPAEIHFMSGFADARSHWGDGSRVMSIGARPTRSRSTPADRVLFEVGAMPPDTPW